MAFVRLEDEFWCVSRGLCGRCGEAVALVRLEEEFCGVSEGLRGWGDVCSGGVQERDAENTSFCESERAPNSGELRSLSNDIRLVCLVKLFRVGLLAAEGGPFMEAAFLLPLLADHSSSDTPPEAPRSVDVLKLLPCKEESLSRLILS